MLEALAQREVFGSLSLSFLQSPKCGSSSFRDFPAGNKWFISILRMTPEDSSRISERENSRDPNRQSSESS